MYERFSDRARKVMQLANQEAQKLNHEYIGTEHVLLGLVREGSGIAYNVLNKLGATANKIEEKIAELVQSGPNMFTMGKLPQTPRTKKVIEYAIDEARGLNHNYIGTEHILLGILRENEGVAYIVLDKLGLNIKQVREKIQELLGVSKTKDIPASETITQMTWTTNITTPPPEKTTDELIHDYNVHIYNGGWGIQIRATHNGEEYLPYIKIEDDGYCGCSSSTLSFFAKEGGSSISDKTLEDIGKFFLEAAWKIKQLNKEEKK